MRLANYGKKLLQGFSPSRQEMKYGNEHWKPGMFRNTFFFYSCNIAPKNGWNCYLSWLKIKINLNGFDSHVRVFFYVINIFNLKKLKEEGHHYCHSAVVNLKRALHLHLKFRGRKIIHLDPFSSFPSWKKTCLSYESYIHMLNLELHNCTCEKMSRKTVWTEKKSKGNIMSFMAQLTSVKNSGNFLNYTF